MVEFIFPGQRDEKKRKYFPINIFCIHAQLIKLNSPKAEINAGEETKFATMRSTQTCLFRHEHAYSYMGKAAHKHMHTHTGASRTHTHSHTHTMTCISCGPAFISFLFRTHFSLLVMSACGFLLFTLFMFICIHFILFYFSGGNGGEEMQLKHAHLSRHTPREICGSAKQTLAYFSAPGVYLYLKMHLLL